MCIFQYLGLWAKSQSLQPISSLSTYHAYAFLYKEYLNEVIFSFSFPSSWMATNGMIYWFRVVPVPFVTLFHCHKEVVGPIFILPSYRYVLGEEFMKLLNRCHEFSFLFDFVFRFALKRWHKLGNSLNIALFFIL